MILALQSNDGLTFFSTYLALIFLCCNRTHKYDLSLTSKTKGLHVSFPVLFQEKERHLMMG